MEPRKTRWIVITGAPCSGKTSAIFNLKNRGYRVVHEVARAYMDELLKSGKTLEDIQSDKHSFEREILYRKIRIESGLPEHETIFLDRGLPDSIAYFKSAGLDTSEPWEKSRCVRYQKVFHFQRLQIEKDCVRAENDAMAENLDQLLKQAYKSLGYFLVKVPVLPVGQRVDFMLNRLK